MKTVLCLHEERGSPNARLQNVPGSKMTQRPSAGTPGCNCDRWGHPSPDGVEQMSKRNPVIDFSTLRGLTSSDFVKVGANKRLLMIP